MDLEVKWISSLCSGLVEIIVTHPIDVHKTNKQLNKNMALRHLYTGITSRLIGIIPMRNIFWLSKDYGEEKFKKYKAKSILCGSLTGVCQTIIDHPIEIIKVKQIKKPLNSTPNILKNMWNQKLLLNGAGANLIRNIHFASVYNMSIQVLSNKDDNFMTTFGKSASSGFIASLTSQPWDYLKTICQAKDKKTSMLKELVIVVKDNPKKLMNGWWYRSVMSFIGMGIGLTVYNGMKNIISNEKVDL